MLAKLDLFGKLSRKGKMILGALANAAIRDTVKLVPGGDIVSTLIQEAIDFGLDRLENPVLEVPGLKEAGEAMADDELDEIRTWLEKLTEQCGSLARQLETRLDVREDDVIVKISEIVCDALEKDSALAAELDGVVKSVRRQTLSLRRMEDKLDQFFHEMHRIGLSLSEIKQILVESPLMADWYEFRKARPEDVEAVNRANDAFLAGKRDEGIGHLLHMLGAHGVGKATIARKLGLAYLSNGNVQEAERHFVMAGQAGASARVVTQTLTHLSTVSRRPSQSCWRSLPRGFDVDNRFRVVEEVGRGGMASVYRVVGIDIDNEGEVFAIKVPDPHLMTPELKARFIQEIRVSRTLSNPSRPGLVQTFAHVHIVQTFAHVHIVQTFAHVHIVEPHTKQRLYGMVMEYIDGLSLQDFLARRRLEQNPLPPEVIRGVILSIASALEHAHAQTPPILHRDLKPSNVMIARDGSKVKLMDFGIARLLEDGGRLTRVGVVVGTPTYMPPEFYRQGAVVDARADVYLLGNLLLELMTFDPFGEAESRDDCPAEWVGLIAGAMSRVVSTRPANIAEFVRLFDG